MRNLFTIFLSSLIIACGDKAEDTSEEVDTAEVSDPADEENEGGEDTGSAESEE